MMFIERIRVANTKCFPILRVARYEKISFIRFIEPKRLIGNEPKRSIGNELKTLIS